MFQIIFFKILITRLMNLLIINKIILYTFFLEIDNARIKLKINV